MKLDATQIALVRIAEKRNQAVKDRDQSDDGFEYHAGRVGGLQIALDILREAGLPVASAEYLAVGGGETESDGSQSEPAGRVQ